MIADSPNNCTTAIAINIFITLSSKPSVPFSFVSFYSELPIPAPPNRLLMLIPSYDG